MYKTLRNESLRRVLPRLILCAVLAVALLAVSGGGLLNLAMGPQPLTPLVSEGQYVSFDASEIIVAFATLSVTNGDGGSQVQETYYLLPVGDSYMAVMDARERHKDVLDKAMEQSHGFYLGDLETVRTLGALSGTVTGLDEDMLSYMADCIDNYALPGYEEGQSSLRLLVPLQIDLSRVGLLPRQWVLVLGILGLVFLLLFAAQLLAVLCGVYQRQVKAVVGDGEADFADAAGIERVRVGSYIWYTKGPGSRAVPTSDMVWGYAMPEPLVVSKYRWPVALYDRDRRLTRVQFMDRQHCQDFLSAVAAQGHPFLQGYTSSLSEQFQNDFPGFLREAERQAGQSK